MVCQWECVSIVVQGYLICVKRGYVSRERVSVVVQRSVVVQEGICQWCVKETASIVVQKGGSRMWRDCTKR